MPDAKQPPQKLEPLPDSEGLLKECSAVEIDLAALRSRYEQYFLGVERSRPSVAHNVLKKRIESLRSAFNRTTAVRFRVKNITSKFLAYERLWNRTLNEIENSTYRRDLFKARRHMTKSKASKPGAAAEGPTPAPVRDVLSDTKLRAIYEAYVTVKKQCREDVSKLTFESIASKLRKQVPDLMKKHNARSVEFKVVIRDGKAILKAVPNE